MGASYIDGMLERRRGLDVAQRRGSTESMMIEERRRMSVLRLEPCSRPVAARAPSRLLDWDLIELKTDSSQQRCPSKPLCVVSIEPCIKFSLNAVKYCDAVCAVDRSRDSASAETIHLQQQSALISLDYNSGTRGT